MDPPTYPFEETSFMNGPLHKWKFLGNLINPLADPIRFDLRPQVKKIQPPRSLNVLATRRARLEAREAGFLV